MADGKKIYQIVINGISESVDAVKSLNEQLNILEGKINSLQNKTVNITATENDAYEDRSGTVVITDGANNTVSIAVSQERKQQQDTHRDPESGDNLPPS